MPESKEQNKKVHWNTVVVHMTDEELLLLTAMVQRLNSDRTKVIKLALGALATAIVQPGEKGVDHEPNV